MTTDSNKVLDREACTSFRSSSGSGLWKAITLSLVLLVFGLFKFSLPVAAQTTSNIKATLHNLSSTGTGSNKATSETQVCVFCHTPHGANTSAKTPLWNRASPAQTYTRYTSSSLDASTITDGFSDQPGGSSMLCLSCHDGMIALGNVNVLNGGPQTVTGLAGTMPTGSGIDTGFTRHLGGSDGKNLTNDHPISITYNDALATADGELTQPSTGVSDLSDKLIGLRIRDAVTGKTPLLPLEPTGASNVGQVQCATCHDPHITKEKFLRLNRLQTTAGPGTSFNQANDQICLACHRKLGTAWSQSAHADSTVADEAYTAAGATLRGFPAGTKVWQAACLNCHDTHTVTGARRLLREGTDSTSNPKSGGNSAIEQTCYQCHSSTTLTTLGPLSAVAAATGVVPDIRAEFNRTIRMPIVTAAQGGGTGTTEVHDISNSDFMETPAKLGAGATGNRHVECTDCHNPHRVIRNSLFNGTGINTQRVHTAGGTTANNGADGNIASGVLRGIWGVEPSYGSSTTWPEAPSYAVKSGNPGASDLKTENYLTREYQLCLKCHSDYANSLTTSAYPALGASGATASGTNGVSKYTNVAAEFAANANDAMTGSDQNENGNDTTRTPGNPNGSPNGAPTNHRSWHPVIFPTGRTSYERTGSNVTSGSSAFSNIRPPFNITDGSNPSDTRKIGKQTMQCSDCHGDGGSWTQGANRNSTTNGPNLATVQGPHGSGNNFLLKGKWDITVRIDDASGTNSTGTICGRCHDPLNGKGGFSNNDAAHSKSDHSGSNSRCMFCHIAVPHGWKNKAFLANLNCLGPEVGKAAGCTNAFGQSDLEVTKQLWAAPYYNGSILRIASWKSSNAWTDTSCGTVSKTGSGWMSGTCQNANTTQQAQNPPLPAAGGY